MKSRLFVVDDVKFLNESGPFDAEVYIPYSKPKNGSNEKPKLLPGNQWLKTIADIMADMLQIEIGDYVFFWASKTSDEKSRIYGVYRAISRPFFDSANKIAPFKIKVERAYDMKNPISEYDVLNCPYVKSSMWSIIGKKIAGKSRGSTPLTMEETRTLMMLLIGANPDYKYFPFNKDRIVEVNKPIELKLNNTDIKVNKQPKKVSEMDLSAYSYIDSSGDVRYEKVLETLFNQELTKRNIEMFNQLGIDVNKVIWYSNYLPYSIEQSEMDYLIMESEDKVAISKLYVIEFQKDILDISHISRCAMYSQWVSSNMALGTGMVQPIIICRKTKNRNTDALQKYNDILEGEKELNNGMRIKDIQVYTYDLQLGRPTFTRKK